VRDAASLPLPSPPPRIPWYLPLKVGSVCSLALVLSVYLFSSIIKNTQAYTEPDREPWPERELKGGWVAEWFPFMISPGKYKILPFMILKLKNISPY